jgi:hypothetical protein
VGIKHTKHLFESIELRKIDKKSVDICVMSPDLVLPGNNGKKIYLKDMGVNYLKVIVAKEKKDLIVITAYWFAKTRLKV